MKSAITLKLVSIQCTIVTSAFPIAKNSRNFHLTFGHSKLMADKLAKRPGFNSSLVKASTTSCEFAWNLQLHSFGQGATLVTSVLLLGNSRITLIRLRSIHTRPTALHPTFSNRKFGP